MRSGERVREPSRSRHAEPALHALVALGIALVFLPLLRSPGEGFDARVSDLPVYHLPLRRWQAESLRAHGRPQLWNHHALGGMPILGDPQAAVFYPPNLVYALLPAGHGNAVNAWLVLLHLVVGGFGVLWWLRGHGLPGPARLAGAFAFALSGRLFHEVVVPGHVVFLPLALVPWQLGAIDRLVRRPGPRIGAGLAATTALVVTGLHPQLLLYSQLLVLVYALASVGAAASAARVRALAALGAAAALALALSAVHLLPALDELSTWVPRTFSYRQAAWPPLTLADLPGLLRGDAAAPGFAGTSYLGLVALLLVPAALARREGRGRSLFWLAALLGMLWFAFGSAGGLHRWLHELVPGFGLFRLPTRALLLAGLPLAYLSASGLARLGELAPRRHATALAFACAGLLFADQWRFAAPLVHVGPLAPLLENRVAEAIVRSGTGGRVLGVNPGRNLEYSALPTAVCSAYELECVGAANPLLPLANLRYLHHGVGGRDAIRGRGLAAVDAFPLRSRPHLDLLDVRWIASHRTLDLPDLVLREELRDVAIDHFQELGVLSFPEVHLYENRRSHPRVSLVRSARRVAGPDEALREIAHLDPRHEVLVEDAALVGSFPGDFQVLDWARGGDELTTSFDAGAHAGFVVVGEAWHPGWRAELDGRPVRVQRANALFRAVPVGPGAHQLRLFFRPTAYLLGGALSVAALALALLALAWPSRGRAGP